MEEGVEERRACGPMGDGVKMLSDQVEQVWRPRAAGWPGLEALRLVDLLKA